MHVFISVSKKRQIAVKMHVFSLVFSINVYQWDYTKNYLKSRNKTDNEPCDIVLIIYLNENVLSNHNWQEKGQRFSSVLVTNNGHINMIEVAIYSVPVTFFDNGQFQMSFYKFLNLKAIVWDLKKVKVDKG